MKKITSVVLSVFAAASVAVAAVPTPSFSFRYGGRPVSGGTSMQVDSRLKVTVESTAYPKYDAVEWVIWFENPSSEKSAVLEDIHDGDFVVRLPPPPAKFLGDVSLPGDRAVVTMNGCVTWRDYSASDQISATEFAARTRYFHPRCYKEHEVANIGALSSVGEAPLTVVVNIRNSPLTQLGQIFPLMK